MALKSDKSAFKIQPKGLLTKQKPKAPSQTDQSSGRASKKPAKRAYSPTLQIMATPEEFALIKEKAGIASVSAYLRHVLKTQTDVFKKTKDE